MIEYNKVKEASDFISSKIKSDLELGIVLGSGYADAVSSIEVDSEINYSDVPNMPTSTNPMHPGKFVIGKFAGKQTICMQGRVHLYEGYKAEEVAFPVFVMKLLGVHTLILTNAAGAINEDYKVGDLVLIRDHINFLSDNPLKLGIDSRLGEPCPDMTNAYSYEMRKKVISVMQARDVKFKQGVYIAVPGPSYETPSEINAFRIWGADLVGMSTVPEAIAAAACDIEVLGISLVSNMAAGLSETKLGMQDIANVMKGLPSKLAEVLDAALE